MNVTQLYRHSPILLFVTVVFILGLGLNSRVLAEEYDVDAEARLACPPEAHRLSEYNVRKAPKKVLLVPLLYSNPDHPGESEHWPEPAARRLMSFYHGQFKSQVHWLRGVRTWQDYYEQTNDLIQQGEFFDRIIFIAHGGYDGPVLRNEIISETRVVEKGKAKILQISESQPGNEHVVSITNTIAKNKGFSDYLAAHWQEILVMPETQVRAHLKQQHKTFQPMDMACYNKFCAPKKLVGLTPQANSARLDMCERVCRPSLYEVKYYEQVGEQRFWMFANSLRALANEEGLIFMGECNAGTPTPKQYSHWDTPGIVVSSKLAGGPYHNYVNLMSSATGRLFAGPIGSSSADDIVKRIIALESNHEQRFLCMSTPPSSVGSLENR